MFIVYVLNKSAILILRKHYFNHIRILREIVLLKAHVFFLLFVEMWLLLVRLYQIH